ncbi:MAG: MerR family transcriptional regulator [Armatimonadota bacterium]
MADRSNQEPVYSISVAARLLGVHPQTLRAYERKGLMRPTRTKCGQRMYCEADLERVRQIRRFTEELGMNLAGVEVVLNLLDRIERLQAHIERLEEDLARGPRQLKPAPERRPVALSGRVENRRERMPG